MNLNFFLLKGLDAGVASHFDWLPFKCAGVKDPTMSHCSESDNVWLHVKQHGPTFGYLQPSFAYSADIGISLMVQQLWDRNAKANESENGNLSNMKKKSHALSQLSVQGSCFFHGAFNFNHSVGKRCDPTRNVYAWNHFRNSPTLPLQNDAYYGPYWLVPLSGYWSWSMFDPLLWNNSLSCLAYLKGRRI